MGLFNFLFPEQTEENKILNQAHNNTCDLFKLIATAGLSKSPRQLEKLETFLDSHDLFNFSLTNLRGHTILHAAIYEFGKELPCSLVKKLLQNGFRTTEEDDDGNTPYHFAKKHGCSNDVLAVLSGKSDEEKAKNPHKKSKKHHKKAPVKNPAAEMQPDLRVHPVEQKTNTPYKHETLKSLIPAGSDALFSHEDQKEIVYAVHRRGEKLPIDETPSCVCKILYNCYTSDETKDKLITTILYNINFDERDSAGNNTLHVLMDKNFYKPYAKVAYQAFPYLRRHADINGKNNAGLTPLGVLCSQKPFGYPHQTPFAEDLKYNKLNLEALVEAGADVHLTDNDGNTPLHLVVMHNNFQYVPWLLEIAPELAEVKNNAGKTAEQLAPAGVVYAYANLPYWEAYQTDRALSKINKKDSTQKLAVLSALAKAFPQETQRIAQQLQQTTPQREVRERE